MSAADASQPFRSQASSGLPSPCRYAGLAADSDGVADRRPPLVLLHGMTFDRTMWRPALDHLRQLDPDRRVLALDLPGHGESPERPSHLIESVVEAVREAVVDARLESPVLVGHSLSGLIATSYAARHPTRGVINVDQPLLIAPFITLVQSLADALRGPGFRAVWTTFENSMHIELLPEAAQGLVRASSRPRQDLVLSYWQEMFERSSSELTEWLAREISGCRAAGAPYLMIAGDDQPRDREWLRLMLPRATVRVWAGTGHFPHLARPDAFAACLAETATWPASCQH